MICNLDHTVYNLSSTDNLFNNTIVVMKKSIPVTSPCGTIQTQSDISIQICLLIRY